MPGWNYAFSLSRKAVKATTLLGTVRLIEHRITQHNGRYVDHVANFPVPTADPADPLNWARWRKFSCLAVVSLYAFVTNFVSASLAPALPIWNLSFPQSPRPPEDLVQFIAAITNASYQLSAEVPTPLCYANISSIVQRASPRPWKYLLGAPGQRLWPPAHHGLFGADASHRHRLRDDDFGFRPRSRHPRLSGAGKFGFRDRDSRHRRRHVFCPRARGWMVSCQRTILTMFLDFPPMWLFSLLRLSTRHLWPADPSLAEYAAATSLPALAGSLSSRQTQCCRGSRCCAPSSWSPK